VWLLPRVSKSLIERRSDGFEFNFWQKQSTKQSQKKPNQSGEEIPKKKKEHRERERERERERDPRVHA
jgi:hypothetical protein